ncbi:MAG: class I SAM-dependent rRNA methyltransferase [Planctomycetota bacterium]
MTRRPRSDQQGRPHGRPRGGRRSRGAEADGPQVVRLRARLGSPHPWVWKSRLLDPPELPAGCVVEVRGPDDEPLGRGLYHPHVTIALRFLTRDPAEQIDQAFFLRRLEAARRLRLDVLRLEEETDAYRLVHAEGDELSGLVVDVLGGVVRVDAFARGMALLEEPIRAALAELYPGRPIVFRGDTRAQDIEGFRVKARPEDPDETEVTERGVRFRVDLREGHKTGFFCDQRENRAFLAGLCRGRRVLDVCTYTGGFALNAALRGEAREVTGVDLDEKAIEVAVRNAKLNQARVRFVHSDAFPYLRQQAERPPEARPEVLVLDPPKLARDRKEKEQGLRTYADLNRVGLEALADEGLLCTCSCSGVVSEEDLLELLRGAAARAGRLLTILRISGAAADHPVALHAPEGRYLKAVFARVTRV